MAQQLNIQSVVRETLRKNAFSNAGTLPPTRLDTLATQLGHFLTSDQATGANPLGRTLFTQGVGLSSITAVLISVQQAYLNFNDREAVLEAVRRISKVIEGFMEQQVAQIRSEQERMRMALMRTVAQSPSIQE
ncbi:MAG TPA: hypothetical protein VD886_26150 [Herpetosiphonaceae bacterium]|nr:hypothetical protein [Herpetosiphonaceae bacterium]